MAQLQLYAAVALLTVLGALAAPPLMLPEFAACETFPNGTETKVGKRAMRPPTPRAHAAAQLVPLPRRCKRHSNLRPHRQRHQRQPRVSD